MDHGPQNTGFKRVVYRQRLEGYLLFFFGQLGANGRWRILVQFRKIPFIRDGIAPNCAVCLFVLKRKLVFTTGIVAMVNIVRIISGLLRLRL